MFVRKAALRPVPVWAVVDADSIESVERSLETQELELQEALDRGYRELDVKQAPLAAFAAQELSETQDELAQSLGYFLFVTVFLAFQEAFPRRMDSVGEADLRMAAEMLAVDEALRAEDPVEVFDSDDVVAMGQPNVLSYVQHHLAEALEQGDGDVDLEELDRVYRAVLIEVIALSHGVISPTGEIGPSHHDLA